MFSRIFKDFYNKIRHEMNLGESLVIQKSLKSFLFRKPIKTILTEDRSRALIKEIQYQFVSIEPCYILCRPHVFAAVDLD